MFASRRVRSLGRTRSGYLLVTLALAAALLAPAGTSDAAPLGEDALALPFIVMVEEGADPGGVAAAAGLEPAQVFSVVSGFAADASPSALRALRSDGRVISVLPDRPVRRADHDGAPGHRPGVTQLTSWGQDRMGIYESRTARVDYRDRELDVDIAIFDSGIDPTHPDLRVAGGVDCANAGTWEDADGHGTLVAGIAAGIDNAFGIVGVAPGARAWSVRVENRNGQIFESALLCGFDWVLAHGGIEVANLSLGIKDYVSSACGVITTRSGRERLADPLHAAVCAADAADVTVVAAAGNDSYDAERQLPAAYPEVIAVSAHVETDGLPGGFGPPPSCLPGEDDHLAFFSNFGATIDFAAPGVCVPSSLPGGSYANVNGTSFSAPHVAGAAALVKVNEPSLSPAEVKQRLLDVAEYAPLYGDPDGITEPRIHVGEL